MSDGPSFYDDPGVFVRYMATRAQGSDLNAEVEAPAIDDLVGDVRGLDVLELGAGAGTYAEALDEAGARSYVGVEGSSRMHGAATQLLAARQHTTLVRSRLEEWVSVPQAFDVAVSRMTLHYLEDVRPVLLEVKRALRPKGRLVFSVEHPVVTSGYAGNASGGIPDSWSVSSYFRPGGRVSLWLGGSVVKYHRTVEE